MNYAERNFLSDANRSKIHPRMTSCAGEATKNHLSLA